MVQAMGDERVLRCVGLRRIAVEGLTIRRRRCGKGFVYLDDRGRRIADAHDLARIRSLAIPPNYLGVRIAPDPRAHLQAIGTDVAGRHQYRYHPDWELVRERQKVDRLATLSRTVARILGASTGTWRCRDRPDLRRWQRWSRWSIARTSGSVARITCTPAEVAARRRC